MKVHFIAIGGSAMHNLAIALHKKSYQVTGSDDGIFEPSKSRLERYDLLPKELGWFPEKITEATEAVILGMHAREDNPELKRAQDLGVPVYSYPEYLYMQSKNKKRVVIGGSHGKTTITSMILHVCHACGMDVDYMVGAQLAGFDTMVKLTEEATYMVLEGDEYLSSPIDRRPKFHWYQPHIALLSGIAWDHINVFPTYENYFSQFEIFASKLAENASLVYCSDDDDLLRLSKNLRSDIIEQAYGVLPHRIVDGQTILETKVGDVPLEIFGRHNITNLNGARLVCKAMGIDETTFYNAMQTFKGASRRLELLGRTEASVAYKDFAHSPSKVSATVAAAAEQFTDKTLVACLELHTFSSLNADFLSEYAGAMDKADKALVYFDPEAIKHKKLAMIDAAQIKAAFANENLVVVSSQEEVRSWLEKNTDNPFCLLLMSSGNFGGMSPEEMATTLLTK